MTISLNRNARLVAIAIALALPLAIGACAQTRTSDSTGEYIDDSSITAKVKSAFLEDAALKTMEIHVATTQDNVELSGFVDTPAMVGRAGDVARGVAGVSSVQNDLMVK